MISIILGLGLLPEYNLVITLPFLALFIVLVLPPPIEAALTSSPKLIQTAMKVGVLSLIVLDATIAVGFTD